uniref:SET domain-containing protein n=1 Tax=Romanomermis culicivorax TaxID=13658 RepID=A0A915L9K8_ROMCU
MSTAWKDHHKPECQRLKRVFPNLPMSEVLFLGRVIDRLEFIRKFGDVGNWQKDRKFEQLITHAEEIRKDGEKMRMLEKLLAKLKTYMGENKPDLLKNDQEIFELVCRTWINSHSIHTNAGVELGMALDLGVSYYDHSCRPNLTLVFDGFRAMLRPLTPKVDANDHKNSFIAYVDVGRSKYQRRMELQSKWFFWCCCERCMDPEDDRLTSLKCQNKSCKECIITTEDCEPEDLKCSKCDALLTKDKVAEAQQFMKSLPSRYSPEVTKEQTEELGRHLEKAREILHEENIYYCRMQTAYLQMCGQNDQHFVNPELQKMVYENYRRCLPKADRHVGYQLLHLVKALIESGRRSEAVQYAYEAMIIFEICFGLQHPYYLQTLALWTFLDKKEPKSDVQLLELMNFNYNRPIDISPYLEKAMSVI